jgi:REP element-mobilizing transposase RayT
MWYQPAAGKMMKSSAPAPPEGRGHPPNNPGLRELIEGKRRWHYTPDAEARALGFRGWHQRGYLPHFDAPHVTQLVTFSLADSFPVTRRAEWEPLLREPDESLRRRRLEAWLDRGYGECWLRQPAVAALVEASLLGGHGRSYRLQAWVIMPNHVHLVVDIWQTPLSRLVKAWKGATSREANALLGRDGTFWQADYWDTHIAAPAHLARAIRYVDNNPTRARFVKEPGDWQWSSARWRDAYGRLPERLEAK